jgi:hypothetical protein
LGISPVSKFRSRYKPSKVYHCMPPKAYQLVEWSTNLVTICVMFWACQNHIFHMYETLRKDYLSSSSIMMIADCMVMSVNTHGVIALADTPCVEYI